MTSSLRRKDRTTVVPSTPARMAASRHQAEAILITTFFALTLLTASRGPGPKDAARPAPISGAQNAPVYTTPAKVPNPPASRAGQVAAPRLPIQRIGYQQPLAPGMRAPTATE